MFSSRTKKVNQKIANIHRAMTIHDLRDLPMLADILIDHPDRNAVSGYYVKLSMQDIMVTVPRVREFKDREDREYDQDQDSIFDAPLLTLEEWHQAYKEKYEVAPDLLINANFFNTWDSGIEGVGNQLSLRSVTRTFLHGLSVDHDQVVRSLMWLSHDRYQLDSVFFSHKKQKASFVRSHDAEAYLVKHQKEDMSSVSGITIMNEGKLEKFPKDISPEQYIARTGVGILPNRSEFILAVVECKSFTHSGMTLNQLCRLFQALGCDVAVSLDGGGSSELLYHGTNQFGQQTYIHTTTSDYIKNKHSPDYKKTDTERPKPNFIGFRIASRMRFFSYDDSDIPTCTSVPDCALKKTSR